MRLESGTREVALGKAMGNVVVADEESVRSTRYDRTYVFSTPSGCDVTNTYMYAYGLTHDDRIN